MRRRWLILAGVLAFALVLFLRMPAAWVVPAHGKGYACGAIEGSLWSGTCSGLAVQQAALGNASWQLLPARLLRGRLAAQVSLNGGAIHAQGDIEAGLNGSLTARRLTADLPLDPAWVPGLPAGLTGRASADLALLAVQGTAITQIVGRIEVRDLTDHSAGAVPLGSYSVDFPAAESGDPTGHVRDLEGPLAVDGTLRLTRQPGFDLSGLVMARPGAPPQLVDNLRFLGSPDASGRRSFSITGSF
ncbi:MAG: type II secretion system protein N [Proteobacteria bacterium]|nr:type II secretion system protein N [Pseudomonadota bacterium]